LFTSGNIAALGAHQVAIIGSRKASHYGLDAAFQFANDLGALGFTITSGLAAGIDAAAHRGALANGTAIIAVFGCGIDRIYPSRHRDLAEEICINGTLISEFPIGSRPRPYHFPRRNRIISGLCCEQGCEVFALPGSIRNPLSAGCHHLIKQGATLVSDINDFTDQLPAAAAALPHASAKRSERALPKPLELSHDEQRLLEACAFDPATFDEIVHRSGLTATEVSSILSALEVRGLVRSLAGNTYLRIVA
jgi:DNA processing protein